MPKTRSSARINGRPPTHDQPALATSAAGPAASGSGAASSARPTPAGPAPLNYTSRNQGSHSVRGRSSAGAVAAGAGGAAAASGARRKGKGRAADPSGAAAADEDDRAGSASTSNKRIKRSDSSTPSPAPSSSSSDGGAGDGSGTPLPPVNHRRSLSRNASPPAASPPPPPPPPPLPTDHFTLLSSELISLILFHLAAVPSSASADPTKPDLHSLAMVALTCKRLVPHARVALYRDLRVETRVQAHAVHRTLHGSDISKSVRSVTANVESMAKTSSQWIGWFLFHSMHSLCGIIGSCRHLLTLTLYQPADSSAWTNSLCQSFVDLKNLHTLIKDLEASSDGKGGGAGKNEGMDVGWRARKSTSMWAVSQFVKPLSTLKSLHTLRLCGISSDSSTLPAPPLHSLRLTEVVLIEVNITNTDLMQLLGDARQVKRFTLWRSSLLSKRGLAHVLKKCPSLVELRIGGSWFGAKEEDDKNFPLNDSLPYLPHLKVLHVSGSLISPAALEIPSVQLSHLYVHGAPSWTPQAVHAALSKMAHDPPAAARLTLPEMRDPEEIAREEEERAAAAAAAVQGLASRRARRQAAQVAQQAAQAAAVAVAGIGVANAAGWNETWRFTVRKTGEAKGCVVDDRMFPGDRGVGIDDSDSDA
ncbi:hypothetical protein JCM8208_006462 [Rhodotorula glutinis]